MKTRAFIGTAAAGGAAALTAIVISACGGGGGGGAVNNAPPHPSPSPSPAQLTCNWPDIRPAAEIRRIGSYTLRSMSHRLPQSDVIPGLVTVRIQNADQSALAAAAKLVNGRVTSGFNPHGAATIAIPSGMDPHAAAAMLRGMPGVIAAGPAVLRHLESTAEVIPNNPLFGTLPYDVTNPNADNPAIQWDMYITNMPQAWALPTGFGSSSVKIAIIDTGYDTTNPDLTGQVAGSIVYDLQNGKQDVGASIQDGDGHGTDTSGIADADTNGGQYVAGTDGGTKLLEARVFPTPSASDPEPGASTQDVAAAIDWAVSHGAKVISMSLGSNMPDDTYEEPAVAAAIAAGVVVVAAAGNSDTNSLDYPGADPSVLVAGASALCDSPGARDYGTSFEYVASYSNWLPNPTASQFYVVAPGGDPSPAQGNCQGVNCIDFLQWITGLYSSTAFNGGSYDVLIAGTSMATPHVAGLAALLLSKDPTLTPSDVGHAIENNTDSMSDPRSGHGRIDALKTLENTN